MPWLKNRPINEIKAPELLEVLRRIETRTVEMSHRALQASGQIFRYGVSTSRYTEHEQWIKDHPHLKEAVRFNMIQCRSEGIVRYGDFMEVLQRVGNFPFSR